MEEILEELLDTYRRKNKDYGGSFSKLYKKYGLLSALIRIEDKVNRLEELIEADEVQVVDESLRDTLMDLAGYALLTVKEMEDAENVRNNHGDCDHLYDRFED